MEALPGGVVTFLFTDVGRSTELVKRLHEKYGSVLSGHRALIRAAIAEHGGVEVDTQGDSFFIAFARPYDAVACAAAVQVQLAAHVWADDVRLSVRMGLHTGEAHRVEHGYVGVAVHRAARLCALAHPGQVLLSRSTAGLVDDVDVPGVELRDLGDYRLKDFDRPERVYQLVIDGMTDRFPALKSPGEQPPISGTVTIVMVEGRKLMRLARELDPALFGALLTEYQDVLTRVLGSAGAGQVDTFADTAIAVYATAKNAADAALGAIDTINAHAWPHDLHVAVSIGLHSGTAGVGWAGPATIRCADLCDAAEAGQIFMSQATASLLEDEGTREFVVLDVGEQTTRRTGEQLRAFELRRTTRVGGVSG
jgi:class 3 adenylate cyclase